MIDRETLAIRPYLMVNPIQPYHWGVRGPEALIPQLLHLAPEADRPYAELWMGAHPTAPSQVIIDEQLVPLNQLISQAPRVFLGERTAANFREQLPFLGKILSAGEMLSIQVHPDKTLARVLHQKDPKNYPDQNHKPEIAYVLDELECLAGFRPVSEILDLVTANAELQAIFPTIREWAWDKKKEFLNILWQACIAIFQQSPEQVDQQLRLLAKRYRQQESISDPNCKLFLELSEKYSSPDIGLLLSLLLQYRRLTAGQAIYLPPRSLHAYIRGNILECMANSDNVVRAGLTPKYVDLTALKDVVDPLVQSQLLVPKTSQSKQVYQIPASDFMLQRVELKARQNLEWEFSEGQILFVWEGKVAVHWDQGEMLIERGSSLFLPAILGKIMVKPLTSATLFIICPGTVE